MSEPEKEICETCDAEAVPSADAMEIIGEVMCPRCWQDEIERQCDRFWG